MTVNRVFFSLRRGRVDIVGSLACSHGSVLFAIPDFTLCVFREGNPAISDHMFAVLCDAVATIWIQVGTC